MFGRVSLPFDRGKLACLWPLLCFTGWRLLLEMDPLNALCVVMLVRLVLWFVDEIVSWRHHFLLAEVISQWHRDELKKKMKAKGIKPSHSPLPPPLLALPHRWMVLSCVMLSMWSVAMAGPVPQQPPVTWVAAFGSVRDLHHSFPPPPPPAPPIPLASFLSLEACLPLLDTLQPQTLSLSLMEREKKQDHLMMQSISCRL